MPCSTSRGRAGGSSALLRLHNMLMRDVDPRGHPRCDIPTPASRNGSYVPAVIQFVLHARASRRPTSPASTLVYGASPIWRRPRRGHGACSAASSSGRTGSPRPPAPMVQLTPEDHDLADRADRLRGGGHAAPGVELRIVDADGEDCAVGERRRDVDPIAAEHGGYWNNAGGDGGVDHSRRLVPVGRRGLLRRRRLPLHPRPHQGHDHQRRREHLSRRDRERAHEHPRSPTSR